MSKHTLRARDYLLHMLDAAERILTYIVGVNKEQFLITPMMQDAVIPQYRNYWRSCQQF